MFRGVAGATLLIVASTFMSGCQEPSDPDDTPDFIVIEAPDTVTAEAADGSRTYTIDDGDNPDIVRPYRWRTRFTINVRLTEDANSDDVDIAFPVDVAQVAAVVRQASGGIVSPPPSGEVEHYTHDLEASGNRFNAAGESRTMTFDVWYDNPNTRREALITVTVSFRDDDNVTFSESVDVRVAP